MLGPWRVKTGEIMNFGEALSALKQGLSVARSGWNGKGMSVRAQFPDAHSKMTAPYLYLNTASGERIPWTVSQADVFAEDWSLI
jgi:hypothetical protein